MVLDNTYIDCHVDVSKCITGRICGSFRPYQSFYNDSTNEIEVWNGTEWVDKAGNSLTVIRYKPCSNIPDPPDPEHSISVSPSSLTFTRVGGTKALAIRAEIGWTLQ